jgi:hypothetical protein
MPREAGVVRAAVGFDFFDFYDLNILILHAIPREKGLSWTSPTLCMEYA